MNFPEDNLTLLSKPFPNMSQNEFCILVGSLYKPYLFTKKAPLPKGKVEVTPTLKRSGKYKIQYLGVTTYFRFTKEKLICTSTFNKLIAYLKIDSQLLKNFIKKKNFHLTP